MDIVKLLKDEWQTIKAAPASIAAIAIVCFWLGSNYRDSHWSGTISELEQRVDLYKEKLQGASPDQAAQQIGNLKKEVESLRAREEASARKAWPTLLPTKIQNWVSRLSQYQVTFLAVFFSDQHSEALREDLYGIFEKAKWPTPTVLNGGHGTGLMIRARKEEPAALALIELFNELGYTVVHEFADENTPGKIQLYIWSKPQ